VAAGAEPGVLPVRPGEEPWTEDEIAEVEAELQRERERLIEEIADADAQLAEMLRDAGEGSGDDQADAGSRTFEREQEISLAANSVEMLEQVDRARRRMARGTYGWCETCGQPIGKLRLMAFPRATLCLSCKEREERR
jgi:RNA polymerase-binding protein DksA